MKPLSIECPNLTCIINQSLPGCRPTDLSLLKEFFKKSSFEDFCNFIWGELSRAVVHALCKQPIKNRQQALRAYCARYESQKVTDLTLCSYSPFLFIHQILEFFNTLENLELYLGKCTKAHKSTLWNYIRGWGRPKMHRLVTREYQTL